MNRTSQLRYSEILQDLVGFNEWLAGIGVPVQEADRAHHALRILEKAELAYLNQTNEAGITKLDYLFGLTEALELHDVYLAFRDHPQEQLRDRLTRALKGPSLPEAEGTKNRDGRNIMFELALGAEWALSGGDVQLLEPDLVLNMPARGYLVACKRPQSEHSIRASVRDAASQLRAALSAATTAYFGIIPVCLSSVLNHGKTYFSGGYEQLSELLNTLMSEHRPGWRTVEFHPRNIAVLFYANTPADWGDGLFRLSAIRVGPVASEEAAHQSLREDFARLYRD